MEMDKFPKKQLEVRNQRGGMIWQVYHVETEQEIRILTRNATKNVFEDVSVHDEVDMEESYPGWRDSDSWKRCVLADNAKDYQGLAARACTTNQKAYLALCTKDMSDDEFFKCLQVIVG